MQLKVEIGQKEFINYAKKEEEQQDLLSTMPLIVKGWDALYFSKCWVLSLVHLFAESQSQ